MIEIRPCRLGECSAVLTLWARAGAIPSPTDSLDEVTRLVREHPDQLLVAVDQGSIVGSVIGGWGGWRGAATSIAWQSLRKPAVRPRAPAGPGSGTRAARQGRPPLLGPRRAPRTPRPRLLGRPRRHRLAPRRPHAPLHQKRRLAPPRRNDLRVAPSPREKPPLATGTTQKDAEYRPRPRETPSRRPGLRRKDRVATRTTQKTPNSNDLDQHQ